MRLGRGGGSERHDRKRPVINRPVRKMKPRRTGGRNRGRFRQIEFVRREYRTRLIADVVTGKLDVREAAAGLADEGDGDLGDGEGLGVRRGVGRGSGRHDRKRPE